MQIDGETLETLETVADFTFLGSKITVDESDCSRKIKRYLLLGREAMTNVDSILKSRNITLPTKILIVKVMIFLVVVCWCKIWTIKKSVLKNWCFQTVVLENTVPWAARRSKQSILKEINPIYSLEGLMLKLNLQYLGYQMQRADSLEKTLMMGKIESKRRRGWQRMNWL